ncbi:MAG: FkbM family methyltransferase [Candidatus Didemnitutus sp.]|nr:FkbM family methyltransferase [Candidatus Didemnitutus sp.]
MRPLAAGCAARGHHIRLLADFQAEIRGPHSVLKIDVEGAEARVFAGASQVLREARPTIFYESFDRAGDPQLSAAGYVTFPLEENSNYLALPAERSALGAQLGLRPQNPA